MKKIHIIRQSTLTELMVLFDEVKMTMTAIDPQDKEKIFIRALNAAAASIMKEKNVSHSVLHPHNPEARRVKVELLELFGEVRQGVISQLAEESGRSVFGHALETARHRYLFARAGAQNNF